LKTEIMEYCDTFMHCVQNSVNKMGGQLCWCRKVLFTCYSIGWKSEKWFIRY